MIIFINNMSTKFRQITLCIKTFIHKRNVVPFFLPHGMLNSIHRLMTWNDFKPTCGCDGLHNDLQGGLTKTTFSNPNI